VYFETADQASQQIFAVRTDVSAFIGIAQMGPVNQPVPVNTWEQFQTLFGSFLSNGFLAYSAKAFFANRGQKLYVVRVVAPSVSTTTTGSQPADRFASVVGSLSGFAVGAVVTATQDLVALTAGAQPVDGSSSFVDTVGGFSETAIVQISQAVPVAVQVWRRVKAVDPVAKRVTWDVALDPTQISLANPIVFRTRSQQDLLVNAIDAGSSKLTWASSLSSALDLTKPITLSSGAETSSGVLYGADGNPTLQIDAANPGIWGDQVEVTVSQSNLAATITSGTQPLGGPVSVVKSVVGFPAGSLVRLYQTNSPPVVGFRTVKSADSTMSLLEWDAPLAPQFDVTKDISFETVEFSLLVSVSGLPKEIFPGLSLNPAHPRYVQTAVTSAYIQVQDLLAAGPAWLKLPDPTAPQLIDGTLILSGGRDGIAALQGSDFTGDPGSEIKTGLRTLEDIDEVSIVAAPDILIEPTPAVLRSPLPPPPVEPCCGVPLAPAFPITAPPIATEAAPQFTLDAVYRVQQALVEHCQTMQFRFAILDSPGFGYPALRVDLGEVQSWRNRFDTEFAALYFPWIFVRDPLVTNQVVRRIPPSGHVAGVYANSDLTVGVHNAPANTPVQWAQALTTEVTANMQGVLNPAGVDCLRVFPGRGLRVFGARTMSSDSSWRFVNVRRLMSMIEHSLLISLQWSVFEPNNAALWNKILVAVSSFLEGIWRGGGLAGNTAEDSFYVKCDATNNPPALNQVGQLVIEIGVAPVIPAEFIIFRIGRSEDTLEVTEV
jgi:hypothetical protein